MQTCLKSLLDPFNSRLNGEPVEIYSLMPQIDFQARLLLTLTLLDARRCGKQRAIPNSPGLGTMMGLIKQYIKESSPRQRLTREIQAISEQWIKLCTDTKIGLGYDSIRDLRNGLSHGRALPSAETDASELYQRVVSLKENLAHTLYSGTSEWVVQIAEGGGEPVLRSGTDSIPLEPYWMVRGEGVLSVCATFDSNYVYFLTPGLRDVRVELSGRYSDWFEGYKGPKQTFNSSEFRCLVLEDIRAFNEHRAPEYHYSGDC